MRMKHYKFIIYSAFAAMLLLEPTAAASQRMSLMFAKPDGINSDSLLHQYIKELNSFDIAVKVPEGFHSIDMRGHRYINENISSSWPTSGIPINELPAVGLEADNNEAVILLPTCIYPDQNSNDNFKPMAQMVKAGKLIENELRYNRNDLNLDIRPIIEVISDDDMSNYANADTAVIYEIGFKRPFLDQYSKCIGIYLRKYAHPPMLLKIALTREGIKNKDKYIRLLLDNISYGNKPHPRLIECENLSTKDLDFPSKYVEKDDLINDTL